MKLMTVQRPKTAARSANDDATELFKQTDVWWSDELLYHDRLGSARSTKHSCAKSSSPSRFRIFFRSFRGFSIPPSWLFWNFVITVGRACARDQLVAVAVFLECLLIRVLYRYRKRRSTMTCADTQYGCSRLFGPHCLSRYPGNYWVGTCRTDWLNMMITSLWIKQNL